ncbi:hypothetical protein SAM23877_0400 [Streptomyces ambofaciens ATCC 23877]|uniref:Uncharacterized protein n=1 Tax=Streptomyces ambofaciens (strain ATCC 23877 / 3486 / DSM 40053 / JCM 4204 / NBRC 12836 / NRRL B-2516) TaxID=278992 RepID=A0A0K2AKC5_STRA7|nr:hypothetical protein SAM23877_0400 [Streptomyces ambofaciens ATCC 23877]
MCASRQAIVVTGAGTGSGDAKSIVHSPEPAGIGAADVPRGRMLQQSRTGSQKYSSSARPCSRGRRFFCQCRSNWSAMRWLFVIFVRYIRHGSGRAPVPRSDAAGSVGRHRS